MRGGRLPATPMASCTPTPTLTPAARNALVFHTPTSAAVGMVPPPSTHLATTAVVDVRFDHRKEVTQRRETDTSS